MRGDRASEEDVPPSLRTHRRCHGTGHDQRLRQVGGDQAMDIRLGHVAEVAGGGDHAGVVHQDFWPEPLLHGGQPRRKNRRVGQVKDQGLDTQCRQFGKRRLIAPGRHDPMAGRAQGQRNGPPDPACRPRHQGLRHASPPLLLPAAPDRRGPR